MRRLLVTLVAALTLVMAAPGPGARADRAEDIRAVIEDQIAAFLRNDLDRAFGHASPNIQARFGTPEQFGRMVEAGYPMVWRPARYEMHALEATRSGLMQTVLFEDRAGRLWEVDYRMQELDGRWRIDGVSLRRLEGLGS